MSIALAAILAGCPKDDTLVDEPPYVPPPERCETPSPDAPKSFVPCSTGGGIFGAWLLDEHGLPAYEYGLDQNRDERASYFNIPASKLVEMGVQIDL